MDFLEALKNRKKTGCIPVIADIKVFSPKEGELLNGRDPVEYALSLESAGAPVLSVVTEEKEFHGSMEMLSRICRAVQVPVLRKDFIETVRELDETAQAGASAILLMVSCLGEKKLSELYGEARKRGLMPLVETHTEEELAFAADLGAPLIGINNRNILELERDDGDVSCAVRLLGSVPKDAFVIVESGLNGAADVRRAVRAGADAVLTGTALLKAEDAPALFLAMSRPAGLKICGVMNEKDVRICNDALSDITGFVVEYPVPVPWDISCDQAEPLIRQVKGKSCVVTGGSREKVIRIAKTLRPDMIQLHYTETLAETASIAEGLHDLGIEMIRSVPSDAELRKKMFGTERLSSVIRILNESPVDMILLDSRDASNAAKGGGTIRLSGEERDSVRTSRKPVMVGGGITAENVKEIIRRLDPSHVDIMTGAETAPGMKSMEKIQEIIHAMM